MKCPKCGKEFSEPILKLHIERCETKKEAKEDKEPKKETRTSKK